MSIDFKVSQELNRWDLALRRVIAQGEGIASSVERGIRTVSTTAQDAARRVQQLPGRVDGAIRSSLPTYSPQATNFPAANNPLSLQPNNQQALLLIGGAALAFFLLARGGD